MWRRIAGAAQGRGRTLIGLLSQILQAGSEESYEKPLMITDHGVRNGTFHMRSSVACGLLQWCVTVPSGPAVEWGTLVATLPSRWPTSTLYRKVRSVRPEAVLLRCAMMGSCCYKLLALRRLSGPHLLGCWPSYWDLSCVGRIQAAGMWRRVGWYISTFQKNPLLFLQDHCCSLSMGVCSRCYRNADARVPMQHVASRNPNPRPVK